MKILVIGCGAIGVTVAKAVAKIDRIEKVYMYDNDRSCPAKLAAAVPKVEGIASVAEKLPDIAFVVEAASQGAVRQYGKEILCAGKDLLVMSVGALADDALREDLKSTAAKAGSHIYIPTGAVAAVDALASASQAEIDEVSVTTFKPPAALQGAPYVKEKGISLENLRSPLVIFEGNARDAVKAFPQNINVAATVALAGVGFDRTKVKIVADPAATRNMHRLTVRGAFGEFEAQIKNVPFPKNPKTSHIAALSAVSAVRKIIGDSWPIM